MWKRRWPSNEILKRPSKGRLSGEWNDDDYDVVAEGQRGRPHHEGRRDAGGHVVDVDPQVRLLPQANARLRGAARHREGGVRQELGGSRPRFEAPRWSRSAHREPRTAHRTGRQGAAVRACRRSARRPGLADKTSGEKKRGPRRSDTPPP